MLKFPDQSKKKESVLSLTLSGQRVDDLISHDFENLHERLRLFDPNSG